MRRAGASMALPNPDLVGHAEARDGLRVDRPDKLPDDMRDPWFDTLSAPPHSGTLMSRCRIPALDLGPEAVLKELARRFGLSGIEEKARRDP